MQTFISKNIDKMLEDLKVLVSYNSVYSDDEKPFGKTNREVLDAALKMMEENGLVTHNLDYYCGYGELGEGDKTIGILAHLDVVPAGDGWESDPFTLTFKDDCVYGRGVSDDKGAVVASMYALKYLKEINYPFKKRVRLIVGCNEETGSNCIKHYVEKEGHIDLGFTPDGEFPGIFAEKGMIAGQIKNVSSKIVKIDGGDASNIVNKKVICEVLVNSYDERKLNSFFKEHEIEYDIIKSEETITIMVYGKAAHASMPDLGKNAISYLMEGLYYAGFQDEFVSYYHDKFALTNHGELLKLDELKDEYTDTSINIGIIHKVGNNIIASVDLRFPVTRKSEEVLKYLDNLNLGNNSFEIKSIHEPLFFKTDSPMIQALLKAYQTVTGDTESKMMAIGGGTYAKSIKNCIAFGCEFLNDDNHIHDANEKLKISDLVSQVEIYVEAIKNLNEIELWSNMPLD